MAERIVVSLHLRGADASEPGYLRRAVAARKRAEVLGATLTAWGPDSMAFDFAAEEVEEAVDLALATFEDLSSSDPRFGAGLAFGEITRVESGSVPGTLAWGKPLSVAWRLARAADLGEVLIDHLCPPHIADELRTLGERRIEAEALTALLLDTRHPFRRDTMIDSLGEDGGKVRVTVPPLPPILGLARDLWDRTPAPLSAPAASRRPSEPPPTVRNAPPTVRNAPLSHEIGPGGSVTVPTSPRAVAPPAAVTVPSSPDAEPVRDTIPHEPPVLPEPPVPPARLPSARSAPTVPPPGPSPHLVPPSSPPFAGDRISWPGGSDEYSELTAAARQALLKGNVTELERLSDELKSRGEADLADRMAGFVAWNRGAKAEGLRKLRAAADSETRPAHRVRALLAYGVALAASGRTDAALLAALGALARAREVADRQGEHVCARFLARLSAAAGYERAARTWAAVAEEVPAPRSA